MAPSNRKLYKNETNCSSLESIKRKKFDRKWTDDKKTKSDYEIDYELKIPFNGVILYRLAFAIWQTAFHLQKQSLKVS